MILKCPNCGEQYEIQSKGSLEGFTMKCQSCGTEITAEEEIKITPINPNNGWVTPPKKEKKSTWKWVLGIIVILIGVMALTCPGKEKHAEKVKEFVLQAMNDKMDDENGLTQGLAFLFGPSLMDLFLAGGLQIDNYFIFNIGRIKYEDIDKPVTLGVFNNVILLVDPDKMKKE